MTATDQIKVFIAKATNALTLYLEGHGSLIYSCPDTLSENPVLLYGLNPGQHPKTNPTHHSNPLLKDSISNFPNQLNLITTERWLKPNGSEYETGRAPYQIRVAEVLRHVEHPTALVTNLVFAQTQRSDSLPKGVGWKELSDDY